MQLFSPEDCPFKQVPRKNSVRSAEMPIFAYFTGDSLTLFRIIYFMTIHHYQLRDTGITFDIFDGEVIALNLQEGKYYNMEGTAAFIWTSIARGVAAPIVLEQLTSLVPNESEKISTELLAFLTQLEQEGLIVATAEPLTAVETLSAPAAYSTPLLAVFTDMQEVIQLDPVHDVSDKGWPKEQP